MNKSSDYKQIILERDREISDLLVLIETLQTNLSSISSMLSEDQKKSIETHSYKWCMRWRMEESERR